MARPRNFDETLVLAKAKRLFASQGYNGTSIDDLVRVTGMLRGSLYQAFGSKRNMFERVLSDVSENFDPTNENLDLLTVALKEMAPEDARIRKLCRAIVAGQESKYPKLLGSNLLEKMKGK